MKNVIVYQKNVKYSKDGKEKSFKKRQCRYEKEDGTKVFFDVILTEDAEAKLGEIAYAEKIGYPYEFELERADYFIKKETDKDGFVHNKLFIKNFQSVKHTDINGLDFEDC